jgi:hypothetical protein
MSRRFRSNAGRWILALQAFVFLVFGGFELWAYPAQTCPYMASSRSVVEALVVCPSYDGEAPVFEMYTFSLGKHITMIGLLFLYFAFRGRSRSSIDAGLLYIPAALLLDWIPALTWFDSSGAGTGLFPPIFWAATVSCALSLFGVTRNAKHAEWARRTR